MDHADGRGDNIQSVILFWQARWQLRSAPALQSWCGSLCCRRRFGRNFNFVPITARRARCDSAGAGDGIADVDRDSRDKFCAGTARSCARPVRFSDRCRPHDRRAPGRLRRACRHAQLFRNGGGNHRHDHHSRIDGRRRRFTTLDG